MPLWIFVLSRSSGASQVASDDAQREHVSAPSVGERIEQWTLATVRQEDAVQWTLELKRAVRSVLNAKNMQSEVKNRTLSDVVEGQFANSSASPESMHALQNVTQLQRNVALMGMKDEQATPRDGVRLSPVSHAQARVRAISSIMMNNQSTGGLRTWGKIKRESAHRNDDGDDRIGYSDDEDDDYDDRQGKGGLREVKNREELLRTKFFVKRGGNLYLFWGRARIRTTSVVRLLMICIAYPFVVIYSVLDMDKLVQEVKLSRKQIKVFGLDVSFMFKNTRQLVVGVNLVLLSGPLLLVYGVLRSANDYVDGDLKDQADARNHSLKMQLATTTAVGVYSFFYLSPIAVAIIRKIRMTSNQADVVDGTFCFRPHCASFQRT